jgi:hypothetical protein
MPDGPSLDPQPGGTDPAGHRLGIALFRLPRRTLTAPPQMAQDAPRLRDGVADMTDFPNDRDDALQRPQARREPPRGRPAEQRGLEALYSGVVQARLPAGAAGPTQAGRAVRPPRLVPPAGGLAGHARFAHDIGLTLTTGKQLRRALLARFESCKIPSGAKGGRHEGIVADSLADSLYYEKFISSRNSADPGRELAARRCGGQKSWLRHRPSVRRTRGQSRGSGALVASGF